MSSQNVKSESSIRCSAGVEVSSSHSQQRVGQVYCDDGSKQKSAKDSSGTSDKSVSETTVVENKKSKRTRISSVDFAEHNVGKAHLSEQGSAPQSSNRHGSRGPATKKSESKKSDPKRNATRSSADDDQDITRQVDTHYTAQKSTKTPSLVSDECRTEMENKKKSDKKRKTSKKSSASKARQTVSATHGNDTSHKSVINSSVADDKLSSDPFVEQRSHPKRTTVRKTSRNSKDCLTSTETKKTNPVQKSNHQAEGKDKSFETKKRSGKLSPCLPEPVSVDDGDAETETTSNQQAYDSFETDEAVKALEGLHASELEDTGLEGLIASELENTGRNVQSHHEQDWCERSRETETVIELQDRMPYNETARTLMDTADGEGEVVCTEAHQDSELAAGGPALGTDGEKEPHLEADGEAPLHVDKETRGKSSHEISHPSEMDRRTTCQSKQHSVKGVESADSSDDFCLPDIVPAPPEQTSSWTSLATFSRKRKNKSPHKASCKKSRTGGQDETDGLFQQPSERRGKSGNDMKNSDVSVDPGQSSHVLSMPFLGEVSMSPVKLARLAQQQTLHQPDNVVRIEDRTPVTNTETSGAGAQTLAVDGGSIMNRFSSLLDQLERQEKNSADDRGAASVAFADDRGAASGGKATENYQPSSLGYESVPQDFLDPEAGGFCQYLNQFQNRQVVARQLDTAQVDVQNLQLSAATSSCPKLDHELEKMRIERYRARTVKRRERKTKSGDNPKPPVLRERKRKNGNNPKPLDEQLGQEDIPSCSQSGLNFSLSVLPEVNMPSIKGHVPINPTGCVKSLLGMPQDGKYRRILPKTYSTADSHGTKSYRIILPWGGLKDTTSEAAGMPEASTWRSGSTHNITPPVLNPLDAAMLSVLPELMSDRNAGMHFLQLAQTSNTEQAVPDVTPGGHKEQTLHSHVAGFLQSPGTIAMNRQAEMVRDSDFSDLTSPQHLVIDDTFNSGAESSPCRQPASRLTERESPAIEQRKKVPPKEKASKQPTKKHERNVNQEGKVGKRSQRKPCGVRGKAPKKLQLGTDSVNIKQDRQHIVEFSQGEGQCAQSEVQVLASKSQHPQMTAQQMFHQMMHPAVSHVVVSESESEMGFLDSNVLTALMPVPFLVDGESSQRYIGPSESTPKKAETVTSLSTAVVVGLTAQEGAVTSGRNRPAIQAGPSGVFPQPALPGLPVGQDSAWVSASSVTQGGAVPVVHHIDSATSSLVAQGGFSSRLHPHHHDPTQTTAWNPASAATPLKTKAPLGHQSPGLSEGFESPRQEVARTLISMTGAVKTRSPETPKGLGGDQTKKTPTSTGASSKKPGKFGQLNKVNINKFLKKVVHK